MVRVFVLLYDKYVLSVLGRFVACTAPRLRGTPLKACALYPNIVHSFWWLAARGDPLLLKRRRVSYRMDAVSSGMAF